ncbi:MAG: tetratricopeptide repeat protein [Candidatus Kapabacteria bacterium]|nr:tetratricopeptide repeat protein [Candidatus Kapabacteria bacterium]
MKQIVGAFTLILISMIIGANSLNAQSAKDNFQKYYNEKDYEKAAQNINGAIAESPKDWNLYLQCGDVYFEIEKYNDALKMYLKADDIHSSKPDIMKKVGRALTALKRFPEAVKVLKQAIKENDKDMTSFLELAQTYAEADSNNQAEIQINRAKELAGTKVAEPYVASGNLLFKQGIYELAKDNYEPALAINPNLIDARIKLAICYQKLANQTPPGDDLANTLFSRSLQQWDMVTKQDPKNAKAWYEKGKILFFSHRYSIAADALQEFVKIRPSAALGRWYLAQCLYESKRYDSAVININMTLSLADTTNKMDSVRGTADILLARSYNNLNKHEQAIELFTKIKKASKIEKDDLKRMMMSYFAVKDTNNAVEIANEYITGYPKETCDLSYKIGRLQMARKQYSVAMKFFERRLNNPECKDSLTATLQYYVAYCILFDTKPDSTEEQKASRTKELDIAASYLSKSLALDSMRLGAKVLLGDIYAKQDKKELSEEVFAQVIETAKRDTVKFNTELINSFKKLTGLLYGRKAYEQLIKVCSNYSEYYPNDVLPLIYSAYSYQTKKNTEEACRFYKKILKLDKSNAAAKQNIKALRCPE